MRSHPRVETNRVEPTVALGHPKLMPRAEIRERRIVLPETADIVRNAEIRKRSTFQVTWGFSVPGEQSNFIPFSSRSVPFVEGFEDIIKDKYLLGRNERSTALQRTYKNQGLLGNPTQLVRVCTCDAATPDACKSPVKVYRYRRFPGLTRTTSEMSPLIVWLKRLSGLGVLSFSWREALSVCVEANKKCKYLSNKEAGYDGFPLASS